jgi:hypothetical protein
MHDLIDRQFRAPNLGQPGYVFCLKYSIVIGFGGGYARKGIFEMCLLFINECYYSSGESKLNLPLTSGF